MNGIPSLISIDSRRVGVSHMVSGEDPELHDVEVGVKIDLISTQYTSIHGHQYMVARNHQSIDVYSSDA